MKNNRDPIELISQRIAVIDRKRARLLKNIRDLDARYEELQMVQSAVSGFLKEKARKAGRATRSQGGVEKAYVPSASRAGQAKAQVAALMRHVHGPEACTLSFTAIMQMTDAEARAAFAGIRWHERNGKPSCPGCGCVDLYVCKAEDRWKCKGCGYRFSITSGTIFAGHKLPLRDLLAAIANFVNGEKGYSAMQLSRDLDVQYKTAFYLSRKIRKALSTNPFSIRDQHEIHQLRDAL